MATRSSELKLSKCGVRFNPPAIILTYIKDGKTRRRTMPIRNFNKNSSVRRAADDLRSNTRHRSYLESLPSAQLEKLLTMIHDKLNGTPKEAIIAKAQKIESIDPEEDLNKVWSHHIWDLRVTRRPCCPNASSFLDSCPCNCSAFQK